MLAAYLIIAGILPSVAKEGAVKPKETAMANFNSASMAAFTHPSLRKALLATFLGVSVMLVGLADVHAASLDTPRVHDTSFRTAGDTGNAGEGASFRTSERGDAGEGASFRTSGFGDAGEGVARPT